MGELTSSLRRQLETAVLAGRRASEGASKSALDGLGVFADRRPEHLDDGRAALRNGLRAKWRQLSGNRDLLVAECAYEQWHRLLFARFLAENQLLIHPRYRAPVSIDDCNELADEFGEPDGWTLAARFAADILPGIFRLNDPCVRLRLPPEGRDALERILAALPADVFVASDALGWVYQFWQKDKKVEVNDSGRRIGAADLGPVTQLFTENYMVRFLLENSLGAWWASRHPESPLLQDLSYLRFDDNGNPAAGSFENWPARVAEVTVMDPCCGSGHFLVEAFSILWRMRAEEEGLAPAEAQDGVLRDNLFGLELDSRCVQIAMFNVALQAWKTTGHWRQLPVPNIACCGIPVKASADEWRALAQGDARLESALERLHVLFRNADTLGSLIDPIRSAELSEPAISQRSFDDADWAEIAPLLEPALAGETRDPATDVLGADVVATARSAGYLSRQFTLVATNVPFLSRGKQVESLQDYLNRFLAPAKGDLATAMLLRWLPQASAAVVTPQNWQEKSTYKSLRDWILENCRYSLFARIGNNVWQTQSGGQPFKVPTVLSVINSSLPMDVTSMAIIDIGNGPLSTKAESLRTAQISTIPQRKQKENPESRILTVPISTDAILLGAVARCFQGTSTGDTPRYVRRFWELPAVSAPWYGFQSSTDETAPFIGRESVVRWDAPGGVVDEPGSAIRGEEAWGRAGVAITQMGNLSRTLYLGDRFDTNAAAVVPNDQTLLPALWAFCMSTDFAATVRSVASSTQVTNGALELVPFDLQRWQSMAETAGPLPVPSSDDLVQWLFHGRPERSMVSLHVAMARLIGYRWPQQPRSDDLEPLSDKDGIVCLPPVAGEPPAIERLHEMLARAYGASWSPAVVKDLIGQSGSKKKNLLDWLQDEFFKQHCALFDDRPFIWHIWDGQRDGFSALLNYHQLDRQLLERVTYTHLGQDWIERQRAGVRDGISGAETRLSAALELRKKLEAILIGDEPNDIYVRWKAPHEQPLGWEPDLNDGVRINIRPFVEAGILRSTPNIRWNKDRGTNPDGAERHNDLHLSLAQKRTARASASRV
jgi:hypothetical protein